MRIVYVVSYYKPAYVYGGPVRSISSMCEALAKLGAQVTVLTTDANGDRHLNVPLVSAIDVEGVQVFYYPVKPGLLPSFFYSPELARGIKEKIADFDLAILEILFTHAMGPAIRACERERKPYVVPLRGQLLPWSLRQKQLKKKLYFALLGRNYLNNANALHCTVPSEAEAVKALGLQSPCFVVPNSIDSHRFANLPARGLIRQRYNIPEQANLLLFLGRLHSVKRPDIAVEALAAAQSLPGETHLLLVGPDEMQFIPQLQAQAHRLDCADKLHITGLLQGDEMMSALADSDLLLMPSESENFGLSAVEAMAAGLPILVSKGVPVGIWAETAGAGRMISCTPESFRQATCELLAVPDRLKEMGSKGQILVREKFDQAVVANQMLEQCRSIVETGRPLPNR